MNVLGPAIEEARRDLGNSDQNRWLLERCLSLLAFAEPPLEGIAKIREILSQVRFFYPHDSRGIVAALGASRCADAMDLLLELAKPDGSGVAPIGEAWIKAVAQLGGKRSNEVLLSFVDPDQKLFTKEFVPDYQHGDVLAGLLADRAEQDGEFKAELFRLANGELPPGKRTAARKNIFALSARSRSGSRPLRAARRRFGYSLRTSPVDRERILGATSATEPKETSTLLRRGDRTRSENAFSRCCKRTPSEALGICAARPDRSVAAGVRSSHGRAATSRDRVGRFLAALESVASPRNRATNGHGTDMAHRAQTTRLQGR